MPGLVIFKVLPDADEGILRGIFGQSHITAHVVEHLHDCSLVAVDQFAKCLAVTLPGAGDQLRVIHRVVLSRRSQILVCLSRYSTKSIFILFDRAIKRAGENRLSGNLDISLAQRFFHNW